MTAIAASRTAPIALWRAARAFLVVLHNLFGAPEDVAARHTLTRDAHDLIASWIRAGEALLRRLLLIEAAAFWARLGDTPAPAVVKIEHRNPREGASQVSRQRRLREFFPDKPDEWRVSFRCLGARAERQRRCRQTRLDRSPHEDRDHASMRTSAPRFRSAWPLAERYEAMLRVFNAPAAFARRLARRLAATPRRVRELLRAAPEYARRVDRAEELQDAAEKAGRTWDTS